MTNRLLTRPGARGTRACGHEGLAGQEAGTRPRPRSAPFSSCTSVAAVGSQQPCCATRDVPSPCAGSSLWLLLPPRRGCSLVNVSAFARAAPSLLPWAVFSAPALSTGSQGDLQDPPSSDKKGVPALWSQGAASPLRGRVLRLEQGPAVAPAGLPALGLLGPCRPGHPRVCLPGPGPCTTFTAMR